VGEVSGGRRCREKGRSERRDLKKGGEEMERRGGMGRNGWGGGGGKGGSEMVWEGEREGRGRMGG